MKLLEDYILETELDEYELRWNQFQEIQRKVTINVRSLFLCLDFQGMGGNSQNDLLLAASQVKTIFKTGKSLKQVAPDSLPTSFIPKHLKKYIFKEKELIVARYEMLLYLVLRNNIDAGNIFMGASFSHRSFEDDLIPRDEWVYKNEILGRLGMPKLSEHMEALLDKWEEVLEKKLDLVNQELHEGKNKSLSITKNKDGTEKWSLVYKADEESHNHQLFKQFRPIEVIHLLNWVNDKVDFVSAFSHLLGKGYRKKVDKDSIIGCLIAYGTNQGLLPMSERSDIDFHQLNGTAYNFIRLETLQEANRIIVDRMTELPMYEHYNLSKGITHSSSDGQKYGTQFNTLNARYSSKYFGLAKGVSIYTLIGNHIPANAKIIGTNEHESHYVLDLLHNNSTKISPVIHSTDMHGVNQVNFALLDFFGYQFAPRYSKITTQIANLYGFKQLDEYAGLMLEPKHRIKKELILDQADNIQWIIASLATKTTTQSNIIRKLSSYKRNNSTQQALWEYDNIVRTNYLLDYIHSNTVRKNVQKALNRGESYHKLRKRIVYDNGGKFKVHSQAEQFVWSEAARLIANSILYYNLHLLSEILKENQAKGHHEQIELLKKISPVAWIHINLYGKYQLLNVPPELEIQKMIENLNLERLFGKGRKI